MCISTTTGSIAGERLGGLVDDEVGALGDDLELVVGDDRGDLDDDVAWPGRARSSRGPSRPAPAHATGGGATASYRRRHAGRPRRPRGPPRSRPARCPPTPGPATPASTCWPARTPRSRPAAGGRSCPTGIALALPEGYAGFVQPRSGLALRHGVTCLNTPGLIDSGYRDELKVLLVNLDPDRALRRCGAGERIAQLVVQAVARVEWSRGRRARRRQPGRRLRLDRALISRRSPAVGSDRLASSRRSSTTRCCRPRRTSTVDVDRRRCRRSSTLGERLGGRSPSASVDRRVAAGPRGATTAATAATDAPAARSASGGDGRGGSRRRQASRVTSAAALSSRRPR